MHKKRSSLILALFVKLCATICYAKADQPTNIILMMGDDHGWEETGYNKHPHVKTPILDEMAASGLRFDQFHAGHANCSPTRASFLTGRHPVRMGTFAPGWSMRPEEITIANVLATQGFRCGHFGKWHVGPVKKESPTSPLSMGFHECLSHDNFFEMNPSLSRNGAPPEVIRGESSQILIDETIRFIEGSRKTKQPFLAVIWFGSPHEPYSGQPEDLALYDNLPALYKKNVSLTCNNTGKSTQRPQGEVLRERYAEITAMDRAIGILRKHLSATGIKDNTMLLYCGDNGTSGESAIASPHRDAKGSIYQGGTLVPGIIEWPARIRKPFRTSITASTSDIMPTLCAITGHKLPSRPIDGMDLSPVIDGAIQVRPNELCFWHYNINALMQHKPKPYIEASLQQGTTPMVKLSGKKATRDFLNYKHPGNITDADYGGKRSIIDGPLKLVVQDSKKQTKVELYNLSSDPAEKQDLAKELPDDVARLQEKLKAWQKSVMHSQTGGDY